MGSGGLDRTKLMINKNIFFHLKNFSWGSCTIFMFGEFHVTKAPPHAKKKKEKKRKNNLAEQL